jgi:hypothetical protein
MSTFWKSFDRVQSVGNKFGEELRGNGEELGGGGKPEIMVVWQYR